MIRFTVVFIAAACTALPLYAVDLGGMLPKLPDLQNALRGGNLTGLCTQLMSGQSVRAAAHSVCSSLNVLVGQTMRRSLKERDQVQLAQATNSTLRTGKAQTVKTQEGSTITTELVKPASAQAGASAPAAAPSPASASAETAVAGGAECGTVKQTVITSDNQRLEETITACRKGDTWVAA